MTWRLLAASVLLTCATLLGMGAFGCPDVAAVACPDLVAVSDVTLAAEKLASYCEPPHGAKRFVVEQFHAQPDAWQEQLLEAFIDPTKQRISLQACAGPGKTCGLAWCGWWFLATQVSVAPGGYDRPKGFATSITHDNLKDNLWAEFAMWQGRSPFLSHEFRCSADRIAHRDHPQTWFLAAKAWPKSGTADEQGRTLSGLHGQNILVLVDESGAIPPTVLRAGEQALPNTRFGKILQAGNPISHEGMLREAATRLRHLWHVIKITGDPDNPDAWVHSPRVANVAEGQQSPAEWAREQIQTYGRDNPWVKAYILGEFPPTSLNTLLSLEEVEQAIARQLQPAQYEHMQRRIGVDVARFGDDRSVLAPRQGLQWFNPVVMRGARTTEIAARIMVGKQRFQSELELLDDTGHWGHGVIDNLVAAGQTPHAVVFHAPANNPRFKNRRAEMWITMADAVKGGAALPNIGELIGELTAVQYTFLNGTFVLEDKDFTKKRIGRSPDLADAYAITYALPDVPGSMRAYTGLLPGRSPQAHAATDYDPVARG